MTYETPASRPPHCSFRAKGATHASSLETRGTAKGGVDLPMASVALVANLETTVRLVVRCGSPIGASVALWREPGCPVSRDAVAIEVLAEWRVPRPASKHGYRGASAKGVVTSGAARRALRHVSDYGRTPAATTALALSGSSAGGGGAATCARRLRRASSGVRGRIADAEAARPERAVAASRPLGFVARVRASQRRASRVFAGMVGAERS